MNKAEIIALAMPAADAVDWADWEQWAEVSLGEFAVEVIRLYEERIDAERDALAEQNEILRSALDAMVKSAAGMGCGLKIADEALALPNISSDILKKRDARTLRDAAEICHREGVEKFWPTYTAACNSLADQFKKMAEALENGK